MDLRRRRFTTFVRRRDGDVSRSGVWAAVALAIAFSYVNLKAAFLAPMRVGPPFMEG